MIFIFLFILSLDSVVNDLIHRGRRENKAAIGTMGPQEDRLVLVLGHCRPAQDLCLRHNRLDDGEKHGEHGVELQPNNRKFFQKITLNIYLFNSISTKDFYRKEVFYNLLIHATTAQAQGSWTSTSASRRSENQRKTPWQSLRLAAAEVRRYASMGPLSGFRLLRLSIAW